MMLFPLRGGPDAARVRHAGGGTGTVRDDELAGRGGAGGQGPAPGRRPSSRDVAGFQERTLPGRRGPPAAEACDLLHDPIRLLAPAESAVGEAEAVERTDRPGLERRGAAER